MRKLFATIPATIVAALLSFGQPALAAEPFDVSGSLPTASSTLTLDRQAGGNRFYDESVAGAITGSVTGSYTIDETVTVHASGDYNVHGQMTCSCTVSGASGTLVINLDATGVLSGPVQGQFTVISGTDGLADLHGQGTFQGITDGPSTYTGQVHFAP